MKRYITTCWPVLIIVLLTLAIYSMISLAEMQVPGSAPARLLVVENLGGSNLTAITTEVGRATAAEGVLEAYFSAASLTVTNTWISGPTDAVTNVQIFLDGLLSSWTTNGTPLP